MRILFIIAIVATMSCNRNTIDEEAKKFQEERFGYITDTCICNCK